MKERFLLSVELVDGFFDELLCHSSQLCEVLIYSWQSRRFIVRVLFLLTLNFCQPDELMSKARRFSGILQQKMKDNLP